MYFFNSGLDSQSISAPKKKVILPPVPILPIQGIKEDPISKRLRRFNNDELNQRNPNFLGVYVVTNEEEIGITQLTMDQIELVDYSCHIGFSGTHNFDIMAKRKSARGLICDINPENALFLSQVLQILRISENRNIFVRKMSEFINQADRYKASYLNKDLTLSIDFAPCVSEDPIYEGTMTRDEEFAVGLINETSWLYTDARYSHIKKLAMEDKIAVITEDICETETFSKIAKLLQENHIEIDTLYLSNISAYMGNSRGDFIQTIEALSSNDDTILIDAIHTNGICAQKLVIIRQIKQDFYDYFFNNAFFSNSKLDTKDCSSIVNASEQENIQAVSGFFQQKNDKSFSYFKHPELCRLI